jgi:2-polyprenyl-6-methoxyphenol hydroxylase-like FAD-dependent oxidoreductase
MIDVLIAGGGYVGLSLAVSLKKAAPHLDVMVVDAAPEGVWTKDERASAVAAAAERMLDVLGRLAGDRARGRADPQNGDHRFEDGRSGPTGLPYIRGRGRG